MDSNIYQTYLTSIIGTNIRRKLKYKWCLSNRFLTKQVVLNLILHCWNKVDRDYFITKYTKNVGNFLLNNISIFGKIVMIKHVFLITAFPQNTSNICLEYRLNMNDEHFLRIVVALESYPPAEMIHTFSISYSQK